MTLSGLTFHKACLRCSNCARAADPSRPMMLGPKDDNDNVFGEEQLEPYCNFCFAKKFKLSAINIADTVNIVPETDLLHGL